MHRTPILAGLALVALAVIAVPAGIAAADSPTETIGLLEAQGYNVNVDRLGSAAIEDCVVTSVRNPQTVTKLVRVYRGGGSHGSSRHDGDSGQSGGGQSGGGDQSGGGGQSGGGNGNGGGRSGGDRGRDYDLVEVVVSRSISVSLDCTR